MKKQVKKIDIIPVKVNMVAFAQGEYAGRIIQPGEAFLYEGNLNRAGELPLWAEVAKGEKFDLEKVKADFAKKKVEAAKKADAASKKKDGPADPAAPAAPGVQAPVLPPLS